MNNENCRNNAFDVIVIDINHLRAIESCSDFKRPFSGKLIMSPNLVSNVVELFSST